MEKFKCKKCGLCCGIVPFTLQEYLLVKNLAQELKIYFVPRTINGKQTFFTYKNLKYLTENAIDLNNLSKQDLRGLKCEFLKQNNTCAIYDYRPNICKRFGHEKDIRLQCPNNISPSQKLIYAGKYILGKMIYFIATILKHLQPSK